MPINNLSPSLHVVSMLLPQLQEILHRALAERLFQTEGVKILCNLPAIV